MGVATFIRALDRGVLGLRSLMRFMSFPISPMVVGTAEWILTLLREQPNLGLRFEPVILPEFPPWSARNGGLLDQHGLVIVALV